MSMIAAICLLLSFGAGFAQTDATRTVVTPADNQAGLNNPDMGWYYYKYDDVMSMNNYGSRNANNDVFPNWPGMTTIYYRIAWGNLEPQKDVIKWELIDSTAKYWIAAGKKLAFRITCLENASGATPSWANGGNYDPGNATWLAAFESFLSAFGARYDGQPYIAYIDIGSIGIWGEGHDGASDAVRIQHIDLHCKYFKKSLLCVNDDLGGTACAYGRSKGMTIRDDSVMWSTCISTGVSYDPYWPVVPTIIETDHYGTIKNGGNPYAIGWNSQCLYDVIEAYHASWVSVHGWPNDFWADQNAVCIPTANLRMGYRLQVAEASWPSAAMLGQVGTLFALKWRNAAVAPCYKGGFPAITIKNSSGATVASSVDTLFDVKQLQPGPKTTFGPVRSDTLKINLPASLASGQYQVCVSVGAKDGTPMYYLPYNNGDSNKRYPLGMLNVVAGNDTTPPTTPGHLNAWSLTPQSVNLHWGASTDPESGIYEYLIYRDGQKVASAADTTFSDATLTELQTYSYQVSAMNNLGLESAKCQSVSVTTIADIVKPTIVSVQARGTTVSLFFSEPVEQASAQAVSNYTISGGVTVSAAALQADGRAVNLAVSAMTNLTNYTVTVNTVRDRAKTPNTILANSTVTFRFVSSITRIRYYPRSGYASRMSGGVFEGTNGNKDAGPYSEIYTIGNVLSSAWNDVPAASLKDTTAGYRYVRYRDAGGYCNVAEIELYQGSLKAIGTAFGTPGSYANTGNDYAKVFDGNTATYMDYIAANGGYAGLDLSPNDPPVQSVAYCPVAPAGISVLMQGNSIAIAGLHDQSLCSAAFYNLRGDLVQMFAKRTSDGTAKISIRHLAAGRYVVKVKVGAVEASKSFMRF
jgi:hypothetical protein